MSHTPVKMSNNKFTFENFFPDKNNNCNDDDYKNDNLFKETPHFFPNVNNNKNENYNVDNNIKIDSNIRNKDNVNLNMNIKEGDNVKKLNDNYYDNSNIINQQKMNSARIKNKNNLINNNINDVVLPNLINERVVNKEIQNLFDNIPSQLRNDPDLKEKVGELLQNINEMKAFIEIKKEQNLKKKRPKSGNIYKIPIIRNDNIKKIVESKSKEKNIYNQNNLINTKPSITERKVNKNKNISHNIYNKNYNFNNQKRNILPSKGNNIRYYQK